MSKEKRKGTYNIEKMRPIVAGYDTYQRTFKSYCGKYDLNVHTFDYWRNRVKRVDESNKSTNSFVKLLPPTVLRLSNEHYLLHFPDACPSPPRNLGETLVGKRLELPMGVPSELLIQLLQISL